MTDFESPLEDFGPITLAASRAQRAPETVSPDLPDSAPTTIKTEAPITISLDVAELVRHLRGTYGGYRGGDDEQEPEQALDPIVSVAVDRLIAELRKEIKDTVVKAASEQINTQVRDIVAATLAEPYQPVNEYGRSVGRRTSLSEQIEAKVSDWISGTPVIGYQQGASPMQKLVAAEVDAALKKDLAAVAAEARAAVIARTREVAAGLLADEVTKR